ncbi:MAB_1171c family putative transporter [Nocardia sp. NPDC052566]|uniref:MAB_1171c family putative transporter n=1 Tax=Nocardia sp. NPDC052566 TaxID=3364330 RepID=UPI0037C9FA19
MPILPIPGPIAWSVIGYLVVILASRLLLIAGSTFDLLINRLGFWGLAALLCYRCTAVLSVTSPMHQLALGCIVMATMHFYLIAWYWQAGGDAEMVARLRFCHRIAAAAMVALLLAGMTAGSDGASADLRLDVPGIVVGLAFGLPVAVNGSLLARMWIRELRVDSISTRLKFLCGGLIVANGAVAMILVSTVFEVIVGRSVPILGPHLVRIEWVLTLCVALSATVFAVPVVVVLLERTNLNRAGRTCRRLRPLWRDLTAAVPEIVLHRPDDPTTGTDARLLRMIVEIRDALLHLGPYLSAAPVTTRTESGGNSEDYAMRLARAIPARRAGIPLAVAHDRHRIPLNANDFDTELRQLLALADVWPRARDLA